MLSPSEEISENGFSSVTLPECTNGWETSSTSDETSSQSSRPSTLDELIGSPGLSPIAHDTDTSENEDFDQNTVISLNSSDTDLTDNSNHVGNFNLKKVCRVNIENSCFLVI